MVEQKKTRKKPSRNTAILPRRPTIISPTGHIRSYSFGPFLALIIIGCLLSYLGGFINSISLAGFFRVSISAATGTTSRMMMELGKGDFANGLHFFLLIISFVLGSFISAALIGGSSFRIQRSYGLVLLFESFALAFGYLFEKTTVTFYEGSSSLFIGAYLVCFACGLQNGMCTTFSSAVIRTTHVTGILTDIGLILGQALFYPRTRKHLWKLKVLVPLYISFAFGGFTGWFAYNLLFIQAILIPCTIMGILGVTHISYCKIILMYKSRQVNKKHWKRNTPVPTVVEVDGNTNTAVGKQDNGVEKNQVDVQTNLLAETDQDLQAVTVHDLKTDVVGP